MTTEHDPGAETNNAIDPDILSGFPAELQKVLASALAADTTEEPGRTELARQLMEQFKASRARVRQAHTLGSTALRVAQDNRHQIPPAGYFLTPTSPGLVRNNSGSGGNVSTRDNGDGAVRAIVTSAGTATLAATEPGTNVWTIIHTHDNRTANITKLRKQNGENDEILDEAEAGPNLTTAVNNVAADRVGAIAVDDTCAAHEVFMKEAQEAGFIS